MKNLKKKFSVFAALALVCSCVLGMVPAQAQEVETEILPREASWVDYNVGTMIEYKEYTDWHEYDNQLCVHGYPRGTDSLQSRTCTRSYRCSYCGASLPGNVSTEYRVICHGERA